jgi:elongation factor 1 alpha-like protein
MPPRRPPLVGADDYDDGHDDDDDDYDDYDDDDDAYDAYDDHPQQRRGAASTSAAAGRGGRGAGGRGAALGRSGGRGPAPVTAVRPKPAAPAAAAGASALAQALCDPPPRRGDGSLQPGAAARPPAASMHGLAPSAAAASAAAAARPPFAFDQPSPDDAAIAAGPKPRAAPAGIQLAPSKTPTASSLPRRRGPGAGGGGEDDEEGGGGSSIAEPMARLAVGGEASRRRRRPVSEYRPDPALAKAVAAAAEAEKGGGGGGSGSAAAAAAAAAAGSADPSASAKKTPLHLAVLGHVDAGKSTLMGRLLHDLGRTSARDAHRHARDAAAAGKASFAWAWALDERPDERARGVTTDVALARFETPRHRVTLLDAPGHRDFVPEMIGGAAQADAALLLVDASPGAFEAGFGGGAAEGAGPAAAAGAGASAATSGGGGQTREHAQLARGMGIEQLAVVVTKLDAWEAAAGGGGAAAGGAAGAAAPPASRASAKERFEAIKAAVAPFLRACGFRDASVQWLPAVGPTGENLVARGEGGGALGWWGRSGGGGGGGAGAGGPTPTVVQAIDAFDPRPRLTDLPLRMPVHDVGGRGAAGPGSGGVVVGGKVECGALAPGTRVAVVPGSGVVAMSGSAAKKGGGGGPPGPPILMVKSLEVGGVSAAVARAGDNVDVVLVPAPSGGGGGASASSSSPATAEAVARLLFAGAVLCHPDFPPPAATRATLRVLLLPDLKAPLLRGAAVTLHAHTAREAARVTALQALLDPRTGAVLRERPRFLTAGQAALVQVELARPVALEPIEAAGASSPMRALGRVALRLGSATAAVGVVVSVDDDDDEEE